MDPIKKLKIRLYYMCGESLMLLSLMPTLLLNLVVLVQSIFHDD